MAKTKLELEGGEGWTKLVDTFAKVRAEGDALLATIAKTGNANEEAARKSLAAQDKANASLKQNSVLVAQSGKLMQELSAAGLSMSQKTADSYKNLIDANQTLADAKKRASQDSQAYLQEEVASAERLVQVAKVDLIESFEGVTESEKQAVLQLTDLAQEMQSLAAQGDKLKAMAEVLQEQADAGDKAQLSAKEQAAASEELVAAQQQLAVALAKVRDEAQGAANTLGPLLGGGDGDLGSQAQDLQAVAQASRDALAADQDRVLTVEEVTAAQQRSMEAAQEASRATAIVASEEGKAAQDRAADIARTLALEAQRKGFIEDTLDAVKRLTEEQKKAKTDEDLQRINAELAEAKANLKELQSVGLPDLNPTTEVVKTLRVRLREATEEVQRLADGLESGHLTPELISAAEHAADLKRQMTDVTEVIGALDPEAKFNALAGVTTSILGGFTAIQGVLSLIDGGKGDAAIKNLAKVQSMLAVFQGGAAFLNDFGKSMKQLNAFVVANTTVTEANAAAQGANAVATTAGGAATNFLVVGIRSLTAAMASNPIGAALVALTLITVALLATSHETETLTDRNKKLTDSFDVMSRSINDSLDRKKRLDQLVQEVTFIESGATAEQKRANARRNEEIEQEDLDKRIAAAKIERYAIEIVQVRNILALKQAIISRDSEDMKTAQEELDKSSSAIKALDKSLADYSDGKLKARAEGLLAQQRINYQEKADEDKRHDEAIRNAKEEAALRRKLADEAAQANAKFTGSAVTATANETIAQLEEKANEAARQKDFGEELDYRQQIIRIKAEAAQKEITQASKDLQRKFALIEVEREYGKTAYEAMTEDKRNALADQAIIAGKADLTEGQLAALRELRIAAESQAERDLAKAEFDSAAKRLAADNAELAMQDRLIDKRAELAQFKIDGAEGDKDKIVAILHEQGIQEVEAVSNTEDAKLAIEAKALADRIALMKSSPNLSEEDIVGLQRLEEQYRQTIAQLGKAKQIGTPEWWSKLLGVDADGLAKLQPLIANAMGQIQSALTSVLFDAKIERIDAYIDKLHESIDETQAAIDREQEAQAAGDANTLDTQKQRLEALLALEKQAAEEKEKLAKRQRIADAIAAQSGMIVSTINIVKSESSKGIIGIAIAAAAIAAMFAIVNAAKGKATEVAKYRKGTESVSLDGNDRGVDTVPAMLTEGEAVVRVDDNKAMPKLFQGIHRGDTRLVKEGVVQLADNYGFSLSDILSEYGEKAIAEKRPQLPYAMVAQLTQKQERIQDLREEAMAGRMIEGYLSRIASSGEELVSLDKNRPTVIPLGPNKYKLILGDVTRTVTMTDDAK